MPHLNQVFSAIVPYVAEFSLLASAVSKIGDSLIVIAFCILMLTLVSIYDRICCGKYRSAGIVAFATILTEYKPMIWFDLILNSCWIFSLSGRRKFVVNNANPSAEFQVLTVEINWYHQSDDIFTEKSNGSFFLSVGCCDENLCFSVKKMNSFCPRFWLHPQ